MENTPHDSDPLNRGGIDYTKFAISENSMESIYDDVKEYLTSLNLQAYVQTRRVNIREINPVICNQILDYLFTKYTNDPCVTKVDIFSLVLDVIDIEPDFFYNALTDKYKDLLKASLQENMGCEINFDIDKKEFKKLGYTQVKI